VEGSQGGIRLPASNQIDLLIATPADLVAMLREFGRTSSELVTCLLNQLRENMYGMMKAQLDPRWLDIPGTGASKAIISSLQHWLRESADSRLPSARGLGA
jgi:hypothetical protein